MGLQQQHIKGVADVVFVLDASYSMRPILEAVKDHIDTFVAGVQSGQQKIDLRLGLVVHPTDDAPVEVYPFTDDIATFRANLAAVELSGDEFTLPAIDAALDMPWRQRSRRFVIVFTDEPVRGGHDYKFQLSKFDDLKKKFSMLNIHGYIIAPRCKHYDSFSNVPKVERITMDRKELNSYDFSNLLSSMGKTVSSTQEQDSPISVMSNLYGITR